MPNKKFRNVLPNVEISPGVHLVLGHGNDIGYTADYLKREKAPKQVIFLLTQTPRHASDDGIALIRAYNALTEAKSLECKTAFVSVVCAHGERLGSLASVFSISQVGEIFPDAEVVAMEDGKFLVQEILKNKTKKTLLTFSEEGIHEKFCEQSYLNEHAPELEPIIMSITSMSASQKQVASSSPALSAS